MNTVPYIPRTPATVQQLLKRADICFDEAGQDESWKNSIAKDLNEIVARVEYHLETTADESDVGFAHAALRIVDRVVEFEGIKKV